MDNAKTRGHSLFQQLVHRLHLAFIPWRSKYIGLLMLTLMTHVIMGQPDAKERVVILTDIEADPDDTQSLVRLFLYANQIDIKAIVATTSCWLRTSIHPASIRRVIRTYGEVQPNLLLHERGYPDEAAMLDLVKEGVPKYGMLGVGEGMDSEGSEAIIRLLEEEDDRPLWISVWGGVNTLAQSLHKISKTKTEAEAKKLIDKLRVYTISDQDDSGIWIRNNYPDLFYIVSPGDDYGSATWSAINTVVDDIDNDEISNEWFAKHVQQGHGPLGAVYPDVSWGVEGDTPAFLSLIPNGLSQPEHPEWGGWGGRYEMSIPDFAKQKKGASGVPYEPETRAIWTDAMEIYRPYKKSQFGRTYRQDTTTFKGNKTSLWRWREDFQNDFAARMDWCIKPYDEANHPPIPVLTHSDHITVKSGESFTLDAFDSTDPDGDNIGFLWFPYLEAGSYDGAFKLNQPENAHAASGVAPQVDKRETIHVILKVTDKGSPALSRYKRVVITVEPL